ncbi:beta strand repeat-containing protein [Puia sp.]|jgi:hypothetical protein|uniref:beta strand repeat-containing protein n=1 Tax=Puia sp. TaxID=2045100 RepID=UPI002F3F7E4E
MSTNCTYRVLVVTLSLFANTFSTLAANISAIRTGNWNSTNTWSANRVPTAADNITVPNGFTVTVNTAAVCASLTINSGGRISISSNRSLSIAGSLSNAGTLSAVANTTLTFNSAANATITGGGTYSIAGTVVMNMGAAGTVLDVQDTKFIAGINTGAKYYFTFTRGTWKMDNTATLNNAYNSGSSTALNIPFGVVIESDAGTMNLATGGTTGNVKLSGELFINGGTVNVQTGQNTNSGEDFQYTAVGGSPQLYITGGTLTVGAGFNPKDNNDYVDFHMTGGTMTVAANGSSDNATFQLQDETNGQTFMSGGLIIVQEPGTATQPDFDMGGANVASNLYSVTGGTVQFGNSSTQNNTNFFALEPHATTNYPNITSATNVVKTVGPLTPGNVNALSISTNSKTTFDASQIPVLNITGSNAGTAFDIEGSFDPGTNTVKFSGATQQAITSSALSSQTFYDLQIANTGGNVLLGLPTTVSDQLSFSSGLLDASTHPLTISTGSNAITGASTTSYIITGDGMTQTGYLAIKGLPKNTSTLFPIGNSSYYLPVNINPGNNGNTAYSTSVYQGVTQNALSTGSSVSSGLLDLMAHATWNVSRTAGSGNATLGLNWASTGTALEGGSFQQFGTNIGITQYSGGTWQTTSGSGNVATKSASTSFGSFGQFSIIGTPIALPVLLTDFKAIPKGRTADLSWSINSDIPVVSFTVEKNVDGSHWTNIGVVPGGSSEENSYSFTDVSPVTGQDYYRLLVESADGVSFYSPVRTVAFAALAQVNVYPNPANTTITISAGATSRRLSIRLVNMTGTVLQSKVIDGSGGGNVTLNTGSYPAGVYFVEVMDGNTLLQITQEMVVH